MNSLHSPETEILLVKLLWKIREIKLNKLKWIYFWRDLPRLSSRGLDPPLCSMQLIFFVVIALVYDNKYENSSHFFRKKCAKLPPHAHSKLLSKWFPHARCNLHIRMPFLVGNNRRLLNSWRIPEECRWPFTFSSRNSSRTLTKILTKFLQNSWSKLLQLKSKNLKTLQPMWARPYDCFLFQGCRNVKNFWWGQVYVSIMCPVPKRSGGHVCVKIVDCHT